MRDPEKPGMPNLWTGIVPGVLIVGWLAYISVVSLGAPTDSDVDRSIDAKLLSSPYLADRKLLHQQIQDLKDGVRDLATEVRRLQIAITKYETNERRRSLP